MYDMRPYQGPFCHLSRNGKECQDPYLQTGSRDQSRSRDREVYNALFGGKRVVQGSENDRSKFPRAHAHATLAQSRLLCLQAFVSLPLISHHPILACAMVLVLKSDSVRLEPVFERATGLRTSNSEHAMHRHYSNSSLVVGQD